MNDTTKLFMTYFNVRDDAYALRYLNRKSGNVGYYTQCFNRWNDNCHLQRHDGITCRECALRDYKPVNSALLESHLAGREVVAAYPLLQGDECSFIVYDLDSHAKGAEQNDYANPDDGWKEEAETLRKACGNLGVPALVERSFSGKGARIWIFFECPVPANLARRFGYAVIEKGAETVDLQSFRFYDRLLPARSRLSGGMLGESIVLPLQGEAIKKGNSAFVDENWAAYADQMKALKDTQRLSERQIDAFLKEWGMDTYDIDDNEWENIRLNREEQLHPEDVKGTVRMEISNGIRIHSSGMAYRMKRQLRRLALFKNKEYTQNQYMEMPNFDEPRYIYLGYDDGEDIVLPCGLYEEVTERFDGAGIKYKTEDKRSSGRNIKVNFKGTLRESQIPAVKILLQSDNGILHAATAFGKTVVCCDLIAKRGVSTLILVDRADLMEQWLVRLKEFLDIDEELPTYTTASGRVMKRKSLIGKLQGAHDSLTGIIDVAMIRSVKKKDGFHPLLGTYGQVIFDECHHGASDTASEVLREIRAKYVCGVTATPKRGDGKEMSNEMLIGPIRYKFTAKDRALEQNMAHLVCPRFTSVKETAPLSKAAYGNAAFELIRNNDERDKQIVYDIADAVRAGRTPVVMTKYVDHAKKLAEKLKPYADRLILLTGADGTKARKAQVEELNGVKDTESLILVGTGSLLGEGFDYPRLDTLFMATPVSGESVVEQYVGRLNRDYGGKKNVIVFDYVDSNIQKFDKMFAARLKAYEKIGYETCSGIGDEGNADVIYDASNYEEAYLKDIRNATTEVVISSPRLGGYKVNGIISELSPRVKQGLKVTIITWHEDAYIYGKDELRLELVEKLKKAGFELKLVEDTCRHYALIDGKILWYGNMNFLSKGYEEDVIIRVSGENTYV